MAGFVGVEDAQPALESIRGDGQRLQSQGVQIFRQNTKQKSVKFTFSLQQNARNFRHYSYARSLASRFVVTPRDPFHVTVTAHPSAPLGGNVRTGRHCEVGDNRGGDQGQAGPGR